MAKSPEFPADNQPEGISLDELTQAFAAAMGPRSSAAETADETAEEEPAEASGADDEPLAEEAPESSAAAVDDSESEADDTCPVTPLSILEAMLFVGSASSAPLTASKAAELMRGVEPGEIAGLVAELNVRYAANACPYYVIGEGTGYRLTLRRRYHALRNRFYGRVREARLSQAAVDVLAIVAYQQPLPAEEISRLRGKPTAHVLSQLVHRGLLRIERVQVEKRRVARYRTTERFLELFGLSSLEDLPQSEDLQRL